MTRSRFDPTTCDTVTECVREIEQATNAELVIVVRARSGSYAHADYLFGFLLANGETSSAGATYSHRRRPRRLRVVSGSKTNLRQWSEYWTFIRNRNAQPLPARVVLNCPNCGAPLKVNVTGICEFCGGKVTSGEFDWVLSRVEQDESYIG